MTAPTDYVAVVRLANRYLPLHVTSSGKQPLLDYPIESLETAFSTARVFANSKGILCARGVRKLDKPLLGVAQDGPYWYPAEFYHDRVSVLKIFERHDTLQKVFLGGTQAQATALAQQIGVARHLDYAELAAVNLEQPC